jgi:topoisomerase-4 subunit B
MPAAQLKETTMDPEKRTLQRVTMPSVSGEQNSDLQSTENLVEQLMGRKPEARFKFIQDHAEFAVALDI